MAASRSAARLGNRQWRISWSSPRRTSNADQIAGLEQALRNIEAHCTDDGLFKEQQQRVAKLKEQVNERLLELQNARVSGKPDKIAKKQAKLEEAQAKLLAAQSELDALSKLIKP